MQSGGRLEEAMCVGRERREKIFGGIKIVSVCGQRRRYCGHGELGGEESCKAGSLSLGRLGEQRPTQQVCSGAGAHDSAHCPLVGATTYFDFNTRYNLFRKWLSFVARAFLGDQNLKL